jgi:thiosulfate/3-mercaptopyruvate sulfurtransferase
MKNRYTEITTGELKNLLDRDGFHLVDVRPADAFNGWEFLNEPRGGHIRGAKNLPARWTKYLDWIEMVRHKQIFPEKRVILYGYSEEEALPVAERFTRAGYPDVVLYNHFRDEWIPEENLPMERLARFRNMVPARWVHGRINGGKSVDHDNPPFVILHAHYRNRDAYLTGHIPGAIDMDTLAVEAPETWNRRTPVELKKAFEEHGITTASTVVVYGKYMDPDNKDPFPGSAAGDIGALRIASILLYSGVQDVRVLNGGFQSWIEEGYEISYIDEPKRVVTEFGGAIPARPELIVDMEEAREILRSPGAELVCVRSWPEYIGEVSGYNYIWKKGRISGAVFADCGSDAYHMENYRNFDHTSREYHEIRENWKRAGITPDKRLAFYCGTGWRGSEAWFNAWLMGWPDVAVYDGGWYEWSSDPSNPVETGMPEVSITNLLSSENHGELIGGIFEGLAKERKSLSCRFFYDEAGSSLFDRITELPEYYPTRTELSILRSSAASILGNFETLDIVELGSGSFRKISILLDAVPDGGIRRVRYIPFDVSETALRESAAMLLSRYPGLTVSPIMGDFLKHLSSLPPASRRMFCFLGSTIGNLTREQAGRFLLNLKEVMMPGDSLLLGMDMVKDPAVLHAAYNDSQGITALFNRNILKVINHLAGTDLDPGRFEHLAFYNEQEHRIEMHLRALEEMEVTSPLFPEKIRIRPGETIHTENSHKYLPGDLDAFASVSGIRQEKIFSDPAQWFSVVKYRREA